jgi:predicted Rossmann-fold nucleotide-binding protein
MKTIIAGGRDYELTEIAFERLDKAAQVIPITSVVCGCARGVDLWAAAWATSRKIKVIGFPAHWARYGKRAGPLRNKEMAQYADALIVFPGGYGTYNMRDQAIAHGLKVFDHMLKDMTTVRPRRK